MGGLFQVCCCESGSFVVLLFFMMLMAFFSFERAILYSSAEESSIIPLLSTDKSTGWKLLGNVASVSLHSHSHFLPSFLFGFWNFSDDQWWPWKFLISLNIICHASLGFVLKSSLWHLQENSVCHFLFAFLFSLYCRSILASLRSWCSISLRLFKCILNDLFLISIWNRRDFLDRENQAYWCFVCLSATALVDWIICFSNMFRIYSEDRFVFFCVILT